jgi:hypothetical protein
VAVEQTLRTAVINVVIAVVDRRRGAGNEPDIEAPVVLDGARVVHLVLRELAEQSGEVLRREVVKRVAEKLYIADVAPLYPVAVKDLELSGEPLRRPRRKLLRLFRARGL